MALKDLGIDSLRDPDEADQDGMPVHLGAAGSADMGSPDAPSPAQASPSSAPPEITVQDLEQARRQKLSNALDASIADNLSNRQSFGNFFLGRMNPHVDAGAPFRADNEAIDQGIANKKTLQQQALSAPERALTTADSPQSKLAKLSAMGAVNFLKNHPALKDNPDAQKFYTQLGSQIMSPETSGLDVHQLLEKDPLLKQAFTSSDAGAKMAAMMSLAGARLAQGQQRIDMAKDTQANAVSSKVDQDPLIKQYNQQIGQIGKAFGLLNAKGPMTHQTASELAQDMGTILSNGRAAGLEQSNKQEYNSASGALAQAQQWITGHPQDALPEDLREQLREQFGRLHDAITQQLGTRANQMRVGRGYQANPAAQSALDAKLSSYEAPAGAGVPGVSPAQASPGGIGDSDRDAIAWAKAHAGDPRAGKILMKVRQKLGGGG